jgi:hypothetical protein
VQDYFMAYIARLNAAAAERQEEYTRMLQSVSDHASEYKTTAETTVKVRFSSLSPLSFPFSVATPDGNAEHRRSDSFFSLSHLALVCRKPQPTHLFLSAGFGVQTY